MSSQHNSFHYADLCFFFLFDVSFFRFSKIYFIFAFSFFFISPPFLICVSFHFNFSCCFFFACASFHFFCFLKALDIRAGQKRVTVGRDTNHSFRVCKVNLAALKVEKKWSYSQVCPCCFQTAKLTPTVAGKSSWVKLGFYVSLPPSSFGCVSVCVVCCLCCVWCVVWLVVVESVMTRREMNVLESLQCFHDSQLPITVRNKTDEATTDDDPNVLPP